MISLCGRFGGIGCGDGEGVNRWPTEGVSSSSGGGVKREL